MSTFLKHIEGISEVGSGKFFIGDKSFYTGINDKLITTELKKLINNKAIIFQNKLKYDAPFEEIVGYLSGCELYDIEEECMGAYSYAANSIYYNYDYHNDNDIDNKTALSIIFHELGHAIQAEVGIYEKVGLLLTDRFKLEQQCETIAYYLANACHKEGCYEKKLFNDSYFTRKNLEVLSTWYEGTVIINDIL